MRLELLLRGELRGQHRLGEGESLKQTEILLFFFSIL